MTIYLNRVLMKVSLSALVLLTLLSCDATIHEGDPAIVADFDFARAWKEAVPTTGAIVELDSVYSMENVVAKEATAYFSKYREEYEYRGYQVRRDNQWRLKISLKAIVNDLGDTIFIYDRSNERASVISIHKLGFLKLHSNVIDYEEGTHYQSYLVEVDDYREVKPYDLMATMRSTYNSIKYLQTIYPDSLIPFSVFEN